MRIALFEPDIPQNTGNIFRLGACLGIEIDIIEPTGYVFDDKRFRRSAMDYINLVKFQKHLDWNSFYKWANDSSFNIVLLTTKATKKYYDYKFKSNDILLFGRESSGVPNHVRENVNEKLLIPMVKEARSINLSSSVAIVASHACIQLRIF
mgnify:CR=1 FL=1